MPIYEYECKKCSQRHEVMQKMSDAPVASCPECQGEVYRLISPSGLSFKGAGWYITDYARKDDKKDTGADEKKKPDTATSAEKKETTPSTTPAAPSSSQSAATPSPSAPPQGATPPPKSDPPKPKP